MLEVKVTAHQIGPGIVLFKIETFFGVIIFLQTVTPLGPLTQKLSHFFYGPPLLAWFIKFIIWAETVSVARDAMIWNNKKNVPNPLLVKEEKQIKMFRVWFDQFYSEHSKSLESTYSNNIEW